VLQRRTIYAGKPRFWGKEIERRIEGGEYDIEASSIKPLEYQPNKGLTTRIAVAEAIEKVKRYPIKLVSRRADIPRNTVRTYLAGRPVRPSSRLKIEKIVSSLERSR